MTVGLEERRNKIHPMKFGLWIGMASITMMFGAFTSAYLVRKAAGSWLEFNIPAAFYASTAVLLLSSLALHTSYRSFVAEKWQQYRMLLITAFVLGIAFVVLQYTGWKALYAIGVDMKGNPSGSFMYILTGIHVLHVVGGLIVLVIGLIKAYALPLEVTPKRKINFELSLHYWHFVDLLWLYLLIFLFIS